VIYPYHRQRPGCCSEHRLARVHQGFVNDADRRYSRPWTTSADDEIAAALRSPLKWAQALAGFITVALVIVALATAAGGMDRLP
jgi:hypothetical protein